MKIETKKERKNKNEIGITLVALIVTIIILLILAGVSIATLTESGLFEKARQAEQKSENVQIKEEATLGDYENKIGEYVSGNSRDTVTVPKEEYEELLSKVNGVGEVYKKSNVINISQYWKWTEVKDKTWTIPAGTWVIDFYFTDTVNGNAGLFTFELKNLDISDSVWTSNSKYGTVHFTWVKTFEEETTGYLNYAQDISSTARDVTFVMNAVRIK